MRVRLQRILAAAGVASRRAAEAWIRAGRVTVNGRVAVLGESADPERDDVRVDGVRIGAEPHAYWLLHKPRGVLTTTADPHAGARRTVIELLPPAATRARLFPVGRLDADSEGLLLLTNDGDVAHALLHPSHGCEREYDVVVRGTLSPASVAALERGVPLDDGPTRPMRVRRPRLLAREGLTEVSLVLREGRKREIRRAFAALGHRVVRLVRVRMGPLRLGALPPGRARPLREDEIEALRAFAAARSRATPRGAPRAAGGLRQRAKSKHPAR
jgi:23S rRNA pseudouridine2605 synthase